MLSLPLERRVRIYSRKNVALNKKILPVAFASECQLELMFATEALIFGPQGRKVISSSARSSPQPPGALLVNLITTCSVIPMGVWKYAPYCSHTAISCASISPELNVLRTVPVTVSTLNVRFGFMPTPLHAEGFKTFLTHVAIRNWYPHRPRIVST